MSWSSPITDRDFGDILARSAKAFFNISDWSRINDNTMVVHDLASSLLGIDADLVGLDTPAIDHFPAADEINALIANIEAVRAAACLPAAAGVVVLAHAYLSGSGTNAPDYLAVNAWEMNLLRLYELIPAAADYAVQCGVAATGQSRFYQHQWR